MPGKLLDCMGWNTFLLEPIWRYFSSNSFTYVIEGLKGQPKVKNGEEIFWIKQLIPDWGLLLVWIRKRGWKNSTRHHLKGRTQTPGSVGQNHPEREGEKGEIRYVENGSGMRVAVLRSKFNVGIVWLCSWEQSWSHVQKWVLYCKPLHPSSGMNPKKLHK